MDELTTPFDLTHQFDVMDLTKRLNKDQGRTVIPDELSLPAHSADQLIAKRSGRIDAINCSRPANAAPVWQHDDGGLDDDP